MKLIQRLVLIMSLFVCVTGLAAICVAEVPDPDLAADARKAPDNPPVIPHVVKGNQDGAACNSCHRTGIKGAPPVSHPERLNCSQCHVPSVFDPPAKKGATSGK